MAPSEGISTVLVSIDSSKFGIYDYTKIFALPYIIASDVERRGTSLQPKPCFRSYIRAFKQSDILENLDFFYVAYGTKIFFFFTIKSIPVMKSWPIRVWRRKNISDITRQRASWLSRVGPDRAGQQ